MAITLSIRLGPLRTREHALIVPLTKRTPDGTLYERPALIESLLLQLFGLPPDELIARASIRDRTAPDYIPSECLVYLIRTTGQGPSSWFEPLYKLLVERVLRALPRAGGVDNDIDFVRERVRDLVFDRFVEMLASDRQHRDDKLDFFEVRFDRRVKFMRVDAWRKAKREENPKRPIEDERDGALAPEVEAAAGGVDLFDTDGFSDPVFRSRLYAAIDDLPPEQCRTMHLLLLGWPIDSSDPEVMTIAKALDCTARSVRNYRKRAVTTLAARFNPKDDQ